MEYKDFVKALEIYAISIKEFSFKKYEFNLDKIDGFFFKIDSKEVEIIEKIGKKLRLIVPFSFEVADKQEEEANKIFISDIQFEISFNLINIEEIPEGFLEEYKEDRINAIIHPYLRQVISDSLQKANLPPFILPPLEFVTEDMENNEKEIDNPKK